MRVLAAAILLLAQAQTFPPPFPREGVTSMFENARIAVWDVSWLRQAYPTHHHLYDFTGVYYTDGDRIIVTNGRRSPSHSVAWDTFFLKRGITHSEEGASDQPLRGVFVEFKEDAASGQVDADPATPSFPASGGKQIRDSERGIIWEFIPGPGPSTTPHRHTRDAVVAAFKAGKPVVRFVPHGTVHTDEQTAGADRVYVFEVK